jgi:hypothetical protein
LERKARFDPEAFRKAVVMNPSKSLSILSFTVIAVLGSGSVLGQGSSKKDGGLRFGNQGSRAAERRPSGPVRIAPKQTAERSSKVVTGSSRDSRLVMRGSDNGPSGVASGRNDGKPKFGRVIGGFPKSGNVDEMKHPGGKHPGSQAVIGRMPPQDPKRGGLIDVPLDPTARPALDGLKRNRMAGADLLPGRGGAKDEGLRAGFAPRSLDSIRQSFAPSANDGRQQDPGAASGTTKRGGHQTRYGSKSSMIGAETSTAGTSLAPIAYDDEGVRDNSKGETAKEWGHIAGPAADVFVTGGKGTEREQALRQAEAEDDANSGRTKGDSKGTGQGGESTGGQKGSSGTKDDGSVYRGSSDGKVDTWKYPDGKVVVRNHDNGTTTTLYPDGSTETKKKDGTTERTGPVSIPDPESGGSLGGYWQGQVDSQVARAKAGLKVGAKPAGNGNTDPADDNAGGTPSTKVENTRVRDLKRTLLGGDRVYGDEPARSNNGSAKSAPSSHGDEVTDPSPNE